MYDLSEICYRKALLDKKKEVNFLFSTAIYQLSGFACIYPLLGILDLLMQCWLFARAELYNILVKDCYKRQHCISHCEASNTLSDIREKTVSYKRIWHRNPPQY